MEKSGKAQERATESGGESTDVDIAEAARILFVSRPYVRELVESGKLPIERMNEGGDARIARTKVMEYRDRMRTKMKAGLDKMTEASDRMGTWDTELDGLPKRKTPKKK